jgi:hypothetical protein
MRLTALCDYPRSNHFIVGDNKGFVRIFQLVNEQAHLVQTHRLMSGKETRTEIGLGLSGPSNPLASRLNLQEDSDFKNDEIQEIYISRNELVAVVTFKSGTISLYDTKNGFQHIGDAVNDDQLRLITQQAEALGAQSRVIEAQVQQTEFGLGATRVQQDEMPFAMSASSLGDLAQARRSSYSQSAIAASYSTSLKVLYLATPNQVALQLIDVKGNKIS